MQCKMFTYLHLLFIMLCNMREANDLGKVMGVAKFQFNFTGLGFLSSSPCFESYMYCRSLKLSIQHP